MPKTLGAQPTHRNRPFLVPTALLILQVLSMSSIVASLLCSTNASTRWTIFLLAVKAVNVLTVWPPCLEAYVYRLLQHTSHDSEECSDTEVCFYVHILCYACFLFWYVSYSRIYCSTSPSCRSRSTTIHHCDLWRSGCWSASTTLISNQTLTLRRISTGPRLLNLIPMWSNFLPSYYTSNL